MSISTEEYARAAKDVYGDYVGADIDNKTVILDGHKYQIFACASYASGLHATAYRQMEPPGGIVIAYRGTDPDFRHHTITGVQDVAVDALMVADRFNPQEAEARRFTEAVLEKARRQEIPRELVTVTGHSMGGTLAQVEAWRFGLRGQTFNAYGAAELALGVPEGGGQVVNNMLAGDPVSGCSRHFGQVRTYATAADIASLRDAGYLHDRPGALAAVAGMRLGDHGIDNFAPDHGSSVLTAEDAARATRYAAAIDAFRSDAAAVHAGLRGSTLFPHSATWGMARLSEATETLTTLGLHVRAQGERLAHAAGDAVGGTARELERGWGGLMHGPGHGPAGDRPMQAPTGMFPAAASASATPWMPAPLLDEPVHPAHAMFVQARDGVARMEARQGLPCGPHSPCVAGALTVAALRAGLQRIDGVELSVDRSTVVAVQGDLRSPLRRLVALDTVQAAHAPLERSSAEALASRRLYAEPMSALHGPMASAVEPVQASMQ